MRKNSVIFKGRNNGITVVLAGNVTFDTLKEDLAAKLKDAQTFFKDAKAAVKFTGRELTEAEESELIEIIRAGTELSITFVDDTRPAPRKQAREKTAKLLDYKENMTYYHTGSIRSGQEIRYPGSVVVIGDVNPGGQIVAEGNVVVIGALKGMVHAGALGAEDCFILSARLIPTQLRIADIITYVPEEMKKGRKRLLQYAYIQDGQIYIEALE